MRTIKKKLVFEKQISIYIFTMRKKNLWIFIWKFLLHDFDSCFFGQKIYEFYKTLYFSKYLDWQGICKSNVRSISGSIKIFTTIFLNLYILKKEKRNTASRNAFLWQILSFYIRY